MKSLIINVAIFCSVFSFQSCDQIYENEKEKNSFSPFRGTYTGSYTGDSEGTLVINVGDKGGVEVIRSIPGSSETYYTGLINSSFNTTNKAPSGFMLTGNLNAKKGTWEMGNSKGLWSVVKN